MFFKYILDPKAADEYENAYKWYHDRNEIAANNLLIAVEEGIAAVCADPHRYRSTDKNLHELTLKKYPYNLIYFIDDHKK